MFQSSQIKALSWLDQIDDREKSKRDYEGRYWDSTKETLVGLYSRRDLSGQPTETVSEIVSRVADSLAIAELRYICTPHELLQMTTEKAFKLPTVIHWSNVFAECIGRQYWWVNTPGNINADPEVALKVLQYEAHGKIAEMSIEDIWAKTEEYVDFFHQYPDTSALDGKDYYKGRMGQIASSLKGHGMLAACGVTSIQDTLDSIQDTARIMTIAAKNSQGMGVNTSNLRPWSSVVSNGAASSGPDRFYAKTIASSVQAVAQGGRRGGALIEWRNSDHPDILFFIFKKRLPPVPDFNSILEKHLNIKDKEKALEMAVTEYAKLHTEFVERQNYLLNTNVSVLAMPGFMEAVREQSWYKATFQGAPWRGKIFDPRLPIIDPKTGQQKVNKLTKELEFEEYRVDLSKYPEAILSARSVARMASKKIDHTEDWVKLPGYFYAPDIFDEICTGMRTSGEPGLGFWDLINEANANRHHYDLHTSNPCGEQNLPTGLSKDGKHMLMGVCNLSSLHAAHPDFWIKDEYDYESMKRITRIQQRAMDNVVDVSWFPIPDQNLTSRLERRTGGGFAGIAEYLSRLGHRFGRKEANEATEKIFREYSEASLEASESLALERGVYPIWEGSDYSKMGLEVRNACMVNNAPTGTLAQAMQTSWGIDPHNGIVFSRKVRSVYVDFVAPGFKDKMEEFGAWPATEEKQNALMQKIRDNGKTLVGMHEIPDPVKEAFPIRVEVSPKEYIDHLSSCYRGVPERIIDGKPTKIIQVFNAISNTCSIPHDVGVNQIQDMVHQAYNQRVKDFTVYPDGSRTSQPTEKIAKDKESTKKSLMSLLGIQERRKVNADLTDGTTCKVKVGDGNGGQTMHVSLNHEQGRPGELIEVYARVGKAGAVDTGLFEAVGRLSSAFLQYAAQFGESERKRAEDMVVKQLQGIESCYSSWHRWPDREKPVTIKSACDGLAHAIRFYNRKHENEVNDLPKAESSPSPIKETNSDITSFPSLINIPSCHKCGSTDVVKIDGCINCNECQYSRCG